jgi:hypothetical protein
VKRKRKATKLNGRSTERFHLIPTLVDVVRCFPKHEVLARFNVDEILNLVPSEDNGNYGLKAAIETDFGTIYVSIASKKLLTFKQSIICASCDAKVAYFLLLRNPHAKGRASLELFTEDNKLLTRDHIMPRSLGGSNDMSNSQTMCLTCNSKKGSKAPGH